MARAISRIQFLRGDFRGLHLPVRPPWSVPEELFTECCTRCGDCIEACPSGLIKEGQGQYPQINFHKGGCDFCGDCAAACKKGALKKIPSSNTAPWNLKAAILDSCLSLNGVVCRSCGEVCDSRAIQFRLEVGGVAKPILDVNDCTGCGECFAVCPAKAIRIESIESQVQAA